MRGTDGERKEAATIDAFHEDCDSETWIEHQASLMMLPTMLG